MGMAAPMCADEVLLESGVPSLPGRALRLQRCGAAHIATRIAGQMSTTTPPSPTPTLMRMAGTMYAGEAITGSPVHFPQARPLALRRTGLLASQMPMGGTTQYIIQRFATLT